LQFRLFGGPERARLIRVVGFASVERGVDYIWVIEPCAIG
jgi:hypothetical protein